VHSAQNKLDFKKTLRTELVADLRRHLNRAKPIVYGSILAVGVLQIVIREYFPELHPPWKWIGGALMVFAFSVVCVPPLVLAVRLMRKRSR
jgi:hypothetical protein